MSPHNTFNLRVVPGVFCLFVFMETCGFVVDDTVAQDNYSQDLVTAFWRSTSEEQRNKVVEDLIKASPDAPTLYSWLQTGPKFSVDVETGVVERTRFNKSGMEMPYVILIPSSYTPTKSYPVEFILHGGVGRKKWRKGDTFWRGGYDSLKHPDKIVVVPAAWNAAYWWQSEQAENLPEILKAIKQDYNVDDNRVSLTGVSDGGTGAYFFAFKQPTPWAAFLPYIGNAAVLRNPQSGGGYRLYFENLLNKPLFIVNGEKDPLYPVSSVAPFIKVLVEARIKHTFVSIADGGHNLNWMPGQAVAIESFKKQNPRVPFPDSVQWVADRTDIYNRNHWLRIDARSGSGSPAVVAATRKNNRVVLDTVGVSALTLLISPEQFDFEKSFEVIADGKRIFAGELIFDKSVMLDWAAVDLDKSMLFAAELNLKIQPR
ncbi:hypothetical protein OAV89_00155 [bacterium]|nr:hypothetical protein [bacterium]